MENKRPPRRKVKIEVANRRDGLEVPPAEIEAVARAVLEREGAGGEIDVAVVGDEQIRQLNRRHLKRDAVTDVLAFPYRPRRDGLRGEVVINADAALREAADREHGPEDEALLYVVHGLLHLLGYDDHDEQEAERMHRREVEILRDCGRTVTF